MAETPHHFMWGPFGFSFLHDLTLWWSNVCETSKIMSCSNLMHHENQGRYKNTHCATARILVCYAWPVMQDFGHWPYETWWVGKTSYFRLWKVRRLEITERWNSPRMGCLNGWGLRWKPLKTSVLMRSPWTRQVHPPLTMGLLPFGTLTGQGPLQSAASRRWYVFMSPYMFIHL